MNISKPKQNIFKQIFRASKSVSFVVDLPFSVKNIVISIGNDEIVVNKEINCKWIVSGGKVSFVAINQNDMEFNLGKGEINLRYDQDFQKDSAKILIEAGEVKFKSNIGNLFKTFHNNLKSSNSTVNSVLPVSANGGDFHIHGNCGSIGIEITN